jgi:hypothetical protein
MARGALEEGFNQIKLAHEHKHNLKRQLNSKLKPELQLQSKFQLKRMHLAATVGPQNETIRP